jgi:CHAD domain-containing protein
LEALQDVLGTLNDLVTAPAILARLDIGDRPDAIGQLFPGSTRKLLDETAEALGEMIDQNR